MLKVKECSLDIITFTITPTIPVAASELRRDKYLKMSFWSPDDGIEIDSDDCEVELKDLQPITGKWKMENAIPGSDKKATNFGLKLFNGSYLRGFLSDV